jgi:flavin-dependent dehydrogenase
LCQSFDQGQAIPFIDSFTNLFNFNITTNNYTTTLEKTDHNTKLTPQSLENTSYRMTLLCWFFIFLIAFIGFLICTANWLTTHYTSLYDLTLINKPRSHDEKGNTAIVMGGGLAGILSARVLFDHFKHVIIVEGEEYQEEERVRPQVPQGAHAHLVLAIANLCLKTLFPSIETELIRRGAHVSDLGKAMKWFYWGSWRVRCDKDLPFWCCSRPFLDTLIRDMFVHFYGDKVTFLTKRQIQAPILSTDLINMGLNSESFQQKIVKANDGIVITGDYTNIDKPIPENEFRVVGIKVKKRGQKCVQNEDQNCELVDQNCDLVDPNCELDDVADNKEAAALLTTTLKVHTNLTNTKGVKVIEPNTSLNTTIKIRKDDHNEEYILGDLIIDATGGTSIFSKWCERLWKLDIPTSKLKANSMYVSHLFHEPDNFSETLEKDGQFICLPVYPCPGRSNYFGYLMRIENKLWQVTAMGTAGNHVPNTSLVEFIHHLRRLDHPLLHHYVANAQPVSGESLHTYHPKVYMQRHWDRVSSRPDGIIPIGNSSTIFDPMYGQGMSGACVAALALNTALKMDKYKTSESLAGFGLSQSYYHIFKDRMVFPWMLCVVEDSRWEGIEMNQEAQDIRDSFFGKALKYWIRQGMVLADSEPLAQSTAMGIMNMTCSFVTLLYPPLVYKVLKNVFTELVGMDYSPEERYEKEVLPEKLKREKWEISPILSEEKEKMGLIYDFLAPSDKKND